MSQFEDYGNDIAIIGMSGAFPGAASIDELWENLLAGKSAIVDLSDEDLEAAGVPESIYSRKDYVKRAASVSSAKYFDAEFFGYSQAEASYMDPQHRVFLQHAWMAMENAGYIPDGCSIPVGVFAGCSFNRYLLTNLDINTAAFEVQDFQKMLASDKDFLATRVSYKLNLKGPSINVQSACSTSLLAAQLGVLSLQTYQCDIALCGGVNINVPNGAGYLYSDGLIFSPDGHCKPFCSGANGTIFGDGVGVVVLKRLQDAVEDRDNIIAVIKGAAVNNDGSDKIGYTAPSVSGQAEVIHLAQQLAEVRPEQVAFIETHGTGTAMGDPIELEGLRQVFGDADYDEPVCALGALKANVGHLDAASGITALIKTALIAKHKIIPPVIKVDNEFPSRPDSGSPFYFNHDIVDLSARKSALFYGVSSFGVGGTNVHMVLAGPPGIANRPESQPLSGKAMLLCSGKSMESVRRQQDAVEGYINKSPELLVDTAFTLFEARKHFKFRSFLMAYGGHHKLEMRSHRSVIQHVAKPVVAFAFSGQGSQYINMSRQLYETEPAYQMAMDQCFSILDAIGDRNYREILFSSDSDRDLTDTSEVQICLFITEFSLAKTLMDFGVIPDVMLGHSLGEYVAATIAGIFTLEDALRVVSARGRLMSQSPKGAMLAVMAPRDIVENYLGDNLTIAIENSPENVVVAGLEKDILAAFDRFSAASIQTVRLKNAHPFHSKYMEPVLGEFKKVFDQINLHAPNIALVSAIPDCNSEDMARADYWVQHIRHEVNFHLALDRCVELHQIDTLVEIGPGAALGSFFRSCYPDNASLSLQTIPAQAQESDSLPVFHAALGALWCRGVAVDLYAAGLLSRANVVACPGYQFSEKVHWLAPASMQKKELRGAAKIEVLSDFDSGARHDLDRSLIAVWQNILGVNEITIDSNFFEYGGDSVSAIRLIKEAHKASGIEFLPSALFEFPTIRQLVDSGGDAVDRTASVLKLNSVTTGDPLFCLCGVQIYKPFAECFTDVPVYGMYAKQELTMIEQEASGVGVRVSIEGLIEAYCDAIKRQLLGKSFSLVGLSFGGLMALEVAKRMRSQGYDVQNVVMFDSYLSTSHHRSIVKSAKDLYRRARSYGFFESARKIVRRANTASSRLLPVSVTGWRQKIYAEDEENRGAAFYRMASHYDPGEAVFDFDVLLIKAALTDVGFGLKGKADYGMKRYIKGNLAVSEVQADHVDMIKGEMAKKVYEIVIRYLNDNK